MAQRAAFPLFVLAWWIGLSMAGDQGVPPDEVYNKVLPDGARARVIRTRYSKDTGPERLERMSDGFWRTSGGKQEVALYRLLVKSQDGTEAELWRQEIAGQLLDPDESPLRLVFHDIIRRPGETAVLYSSRFVGRAVHLDVANRGADGKPHIAQRYELWKEEYTDHPVRDACLVWLNGYFVFTTNQEMGTEIWQASEGKLKHIFGEARKHLRTTPPGAEPDEKPAEPVPDASPRK